MDLALHDWPLPYEERLDTRAPSSIDLVVVHCTETPDLATARQFGERIHYASGTGNSGHYYIDRDGSVHVFVRPDRIAHHVRGHNERAIGIELVNTGRWPDWHHSRHQAMAEAYTEAQLVALEALLARLRGELPALAYIAGHEDLDRERMPASDDAAVEIARKVDPGPLFPWERIEAASGLERLRVAVDD